MAIEGARPNDRRVVAHLLVRNLENAIDFYRRAFGASELYRSTSGPGGKVLHAHLAIGGSVVMFSEENMAMPEEVWARHEVGMRTRSPQSLRGTSVILEMYVDDVDAAYKPPSAGITSCAST